MALDEIITIRISKQEKDILQQKADELNIKLNKLARLKLIYVHVEPTHTIVAANLECRKQLNNIDFQLRKIGTNINQLAHNANLSMQMGTPMQAEIKKLDEIFTVIAEMQSLISDVYSQISSTKGTVSANK
jgi:hypothetical protein